MKMQFSCKWWAVFKNYGVCVDVQEGHTALLSKVGSSKINGWIPCDYESEYFCKLQKEQLRKE